MSGEHTEYLFTRDEALKSIKRQPAKTRFYIRVWPELPMVNDPNKYIGGCASVPVSRAVCIKIAADVLNKTTEERGARISVREYVSGDYRAFYLFG